MSDEKAPPRTAPAPPAPAPAPAESPEPIREIHKDIWTERIQKMEREDPWPPPPPDKP